MHDCMITGYVNCWSLYDITSYVICCAKCHLHPFLPFSSITMPPSWKMLSVQKTPENSTLQAYRLIMRINPILYAFFSDDSDRPEIFQLYQSASIVIHILRVTQYLIFSKHNLPLSVNLIYYHLLNYPYYTKYATQDSMIFTTIISILQYCYHIVTIL